MTFVNWLGLGDAGGRNYGYVNDDGGDGESSTKSKIIFFVFFVVVVVLVFVGLVVVLVVRSKMTNLHSNVDDEDANNRKSLWQRMSLQLLQRFQM